MSKTQFEINIERTMKFAKTPNIKSKEYHLVDGELVFKGEINMQDVINSNKVDTLTEMYEKYLNGELTPHGQNDNGEIIDFTQTLGKDKLEQLMVQQNAFNDALTQYNLPITTTPQQLSDYIAQLQQSQQQPQQQPNQPIYSGPDPE